MSGLLIGSDVSGALSLFPSTIPRASPVFVIGAPQLTESYSRALARHGRRPCSIEGDKAALAGLGLRVSRAGAPEIDEPER